MSSINYTGKDPLLLRICAMINEIEEGGTGGGHEYTLGLDGHEITLTDELGNVQRVTVPDDDTTYQFEFGGDTLTITPSAGDAETVEIPLSGKQDALSEKQLQNIAAVDGKQDALTAEQLQAIADVGNKQDKLTETQLQNIADVPSKQDKLSTEQIDNINAVPNKQDALTVEQIANISAVPNKQNKLTAGEGITIEGDTISAEVLPLSVVDGKLCITYEEV